MQTTRAVETNHKGWNPGQEVTGRTKGQQNMETILHGMTFLSICLTKLLDHVRVSFRNIVVLAGSVIHTVGQDSQPSLIETTSSLR